MSRLSPANRAPFAEAFVEERNHGLCVGVWLPLRGATPADDALATLHPEERAHAMGLAVERRRTWVGGRIALRRAFAHAGVPLPDEPLLATPRGAPALPAQVLGSVSHKDTLAVALLAKAQGEASAPPAAVGVDVEEDAPRPRDVARLVLTAEELAALPSDPVARQAHVLVAFSVKEALYKALDRFVGRYVSFHEATVMLEEGGVGGRGAPLGTEEGGAVGLRLALRGGEGPFRCEGAWWRREGHVLTTVRVEKLR